MSKNFDATILKRNSDQNNLKIKINHLGKDHFLEVHYKAGYKLFLNGYKLDEKKWSMIGKSLVEGYTWGIVKNVTKFNFDFVAGDSRYKSQLKFKQDNSGDYHGINLIIDGNVILHKEVSNKPFK